MCAVCRKNPCDSRCPNAEEPRSIYTCEWCKEPIYEGDKYMDTPEGPVCKDCIEGMSVTEFCELIGETFKTAEKMKYGTFAMHCSLPYALFYGTKTWTEQEPQQL